MPGIRLGRGICDEGCESATRRPTRAQCIVPRDSRRARFAATRDEAAFELLVWRHGAMVLAACRRVLGHTEDAEDVFQAVFLVLARKAASVRRGTAVPAWLHRVAVRIARRTACRRRPTAPSRHRTTGPNPRPDAAERRRTPRLASTSPRSTAFRNRSAGRSRAAATSKRLSNADARGFSEVPGGNDRVAASPPLGARSGTVWRGGSSCQPAFSLYWRALP